MQVVILAGGLGTRLSEETVSIPKPMVTVGDDPILLHIMRHFASYGHTNFLIALGYKGYVIKEFFANYALHNSDFRVDISSKKIEIIRTHSEKWTVDLIDTGQETMTGGRILRLKEFLEDEFLMTYGDGLSDIDLNRLISYHKSHGKIATLTAVRPISRFGVLDLSSNGEVESFQEKPQAEGWINAGYFVFEPKIFDYLEPNSILEREPMANLAKDGQLVAFRHEGFFQPMDTYREMSLLNEMWDEGKAPWKVWK